MARHLAYVDTSAYLKLLFTEAESETLEAVMSEWPDLVSSELLDVEMHRAAYRQGVAAEDCEKLLDAVNLIAFDEQIRQHARRIGLPELRAADAIHLATSASIGTDLGVLFTYDRRMLDSGLLEGLPVWAPEPGI